jgi:hypothetical protein
VSAAIRARTTLRSTSRCRTSSRSAAPGSRLGFAGFQSFKLGLAQALAIERPRGMNEELSAFRGIADGSSGRSA